MTPDSAGPAGQDHIRGSAAQDAPVGPRGGAGSPELRAHSETRDTRPRLSDPSARVGSEPQAQQVNPAEVPAPAATVTVDRHDLNAAWGILVAYASRVHDDGVRANVAALADRLRAVLEATNGA